ncbi:Uncharacterised protein [Legionella feeleii]|uniref:Uncharacterized protein n=1 Tax=Legionella feeleii TaxID=453 RepID=A0A2X1R6D4_9GAMM|nr:Uncharacterised protein [Legionella feeleii]
MSSEAQAINAFRAWIVERSTALNYLVAFFSFLTLTSGLLFLSKGRATQ